MNWGDLTKVSLSPLQEIRDQRLTEANIRLWFKRDDLLHPTPPDPFSGNKWRKLKYNLLAARDKSLPLVSFGGAHSNHIAAVASACAQLGLTSIGIIRGEDIASPTLELARQKGMQLHFISRSAYREKMVPDQVGSHILIPEGGTNELALQGTKEIVEELRQQSPEQFPDYISLPVGTGGTVAGIIQGLEGQAQVLGFPVLKGDFLEQEINQLLAPQEFDNWQLIKDYHFGGYARWQLALIDFIKDFYQKYQIAIDPIYGAKHLYGLFDLIAKGYFPTKSSIVAIHTGGLQGIRGFNERFGTDLPKS